MKYTNFVAQSAVTGERMFNLRTELVEEGKIRKKKTKDFSIAHTENTDNFSREL